MLPRVIPVLAPGLRMAGSLAATGVPFDEGLGNATVVGEPESETSALEPHAERTRAVAIIPAA